jgi:hypothetical protein
MGSSFEFQDISAAVTVVDTAPRDGFVFTPGTPGPAGRDLRIDGTAPTYAALTEIAPTRIGEIWQTIDTGMLHTWTTDGWPPEEDGHLLQGPQGERGRGITSLAIDGDVLVADMSSGDDERVTVPAITAAEASAAAAALSASRAETNRVTASGAASAAAGSATRAEDAATAAGNAEASVNDAASRAEVARDQAEASAEAAATDAAEVGDAREYVSGVHADLSPGGATTALFEGLTNSASSAASQAGEARDAAAASATAAHGHANRAEVAADGVDQVVSDAAGVLAGELADDVAAAQSARTDAESARDQAVGAASQATTKAGEASASATLADGRATDAEGAVASIAAHATDAEDAAGRAAVSASNASSSATTAQGHADRAATEAGAAAQIAAAEKIAELVGDAPSDLDTLYELAAAFTDRGDAIAAIQSALANRVMGNHSSVIASTAPSPGTPTNQVTFVVEGT